MRAIVLQKTQITDIASGKNYSTNIQEYENVTSIEEVISSSTKVYRLTYTSGGDSIPLLFTQSDYVISIRP